MPSRNRKAPFVVGICGGSGAGKTYVLELLNRQLGQQACLLSQDHYYKPLAQQQRDDNGQVNFDLPSGIDQERFASDLQRLKRGEPVSLREYTFNNPALQPRSLHLEPAPLIIVEGLFIFHFESIRNQLSLKVFIESADTLALERRLERDQRERAYPEKLIRYQWEHHVKPAYLRYLMPYRETADLIIHNASKSEPDLRPLLNLIWTQSK